MVWAGSERGLTPICCTGNGTGTRPPQAAILPHPTPQSDGPGQGREGCKGGPCSLLNTIGKRGCDHLFICLSGGLSQHWGPPHAHLPFTYSLPFKTIIHILPVHTQICNSPLNIYLSVCLCVCMCLSSCMAETRPCLCVYAFCWS